MEEFGESIRCTGRGEERKRKPEGEREKKNGTTVANAQWSLLQTGKQRFYRKAGNYGKVWGYQEQQKIAKSKISILFK